MTTKRNVWPIGIIVGLGAVVVANAVMITIAITHPSAPASDDHWAESLDWDRELAAREASAALGWSIVSMRVGADGALELEIVDASGQGVSGLHGTLTLARADTATQDRTLEWLEIGGGRYRSTGELPERGLFVATVDLQRASGERFVVQRRLEFAVRGASS